jgi:F420-non-reducing hydrogenase iron-sulfur subunit
MAGVTADGGFAPRILVFSTNNISDPGIDLAGSSHLHYSPTVVVISLPCTSGIKPSWVTYAIDQGFDGVFIATDGEECAYLPDCSERTAKITADAQAMLQEKAQEPKRVKMAAVCSVCADPFVNYMREFSELLVGLGPSRPSGRPGSSAKRSSGSGKRSPGAKAA